MEGNDFMLLTIAFHSQLHIFKELLYIYNIVNIGLLLHNYIANYFMLSILLIHDEHA